jgi:hypothetical protein
MSAEVLRRAAALANQRADAAVPGRWTVNGMDVIHPGRLDLDASVADAHGEDTAEHIAAADPTFLRAVAAWWEAEADSTPPWDAPSPQALAAARAYLREGS